MRVVIPTNSAEFLPVTLMPLAASYRVESVVILDTGGRSCVYNKAVMKVIDYLTLLGKEVLIERFRGPLTMMSLRGKQASYYDGRHLMFLDDDVIVSQDFLDAATNTGGSAFVSSSVASIDDAEGFKVRTPFGPHTEKWCETEDKSSKVAGPDDFYSACTVVRCQKAIEEIVGVAEERKGVQEGEELVIGRRLKMKSLHGVVFSGFRVFHLGNEWSKVDLIKKMESVRGSL